jgi:L-2-hydroxyglutarate oxidase
MNSDFYDISIIGGGIIGLSTALAVQKRFPGYSMAIIEKENEVACHQTGHNSGVIHSGIYYKPGSSKANLCVEGARLMYEFCQTNNVPYDRCGKLIVATKEEELQQLQILYERGNANGIEGLEIIDPERVREIEPYANAVKAIYSPNTGIVDYGQVSRAMTENIIRSGGNIRLSTRVTGIHKHNGRYYIETDSGRVECRFIINCAGLYADRVAHMTGVNKNVIIVPFRGEYYTLRPETRLVRNLIYPVPDPQFPFLGVHFTRRINGEFEAGPNAVLAFAREGYRLQDICLGDIADIFSYPGFWKMALRYWHVQIFELYRSLSRRAFLEALQKLVPDLQDRDIKRGGAGVRAQAVTSDGRLADDFIIAETENVIHVLNAPSPAATASIAIGKYIASLAEKRFK